MINADVNDDFDQVLDTVQQLVGGSNNSRNTQKCDSDSAKKESSAEEKWKKWKSEYLKDGEESINEFSKDEHASLTEKEDDNTEIVSEKSLLEEKDNTENLGPAPTETVQSDPSLDQDDNGNPDLVLRLDSSIDFDEDTLQAFNGAQEERRGKDGSRDDGGQDDGGQDGVHHLSDGGMIELSACGTVDPVVMQAFDDLDEAIIVKEEDGDSICDMIDLSSDEEKEESQDISVVLLKRPPAQENANVANDTIQIDDSDDEFPIFLDEAEKQENFNVEEKTGYVKDFVEREGLGMLYAE